MRLLAFTIITAIAISGFSQEGQFSQYYASGPVLNPAFIGTVPTISLTSNYKRSGSKSNESFLELMQATVSYPFKKRTSRDFQIGAAGVTFWKESRGFQGLYTAQKILLTGAYSIKFSRLSKQTLTFGLQGGMVQNQLNDASFQWGSQFSRYIGFDDARDGESIGTEPLLFPTFNFGVIYSTYDNDNYFVRDRSILVGFSADYLNEPSLEQQGFGIAERSRIFRAFGYANFNVAPRVAIFPSGYVLYSDGNQQINAGMYFSTLVSAPRAYNAVMLQAGAWYRVEDSFILLAGFKLNEIRVGISADLNASSFDINQALGGSLPSYEISLTYNLDLSQSFNNVSSPIF